MYALTGYKQLKVRVQLVRDSPTTVLPKIQFDSAKDVYNLLKDEVLSWDREKFLSIMLNSRNQVIAIDEVGIGSLDKTVVHPREVFKSAILANAIGVVLVHNHRSGLMKLTSATVVAQAFPKSEDLRFVGSGQVLNGWKGIEKPPVVVDHRPHLGLLQHDFADPDFVRIMRAPPRQIARVFTEPSQDPSTKGLAPRRIWEVKVQGSLRRGGFAIHGRS